MAELRCDVVVVQCEDLLVVQVFGDHRPEEAEWLIMLARQQSREEVVFVTTQPDVYHVGDYFTFL